jgi:hypothetical protein
MMYAITREYCSVSSVHPDRDRNNESPAGVAQALVEILVQLEPCRDLVELGQGGSQHRRFELGFVSHESPFR